MSLYQELNSQRVQSTINNPQLNSIIQMVKESKKSPKELFYQKAQELGVNPETILNKLR